jgi:hypothetical protein
MACGVREEMPIPSLAYRGSMDPRRLLLDLGDVSGPMPADDAPQAEWDAWMQAEEFEGMLAGMVGRSAEPRDREYVSQLWLMLAQVSLRDRLGDRITVAEQLVEALSDRM